jgi:hypothetical protein
VSSKKGKERDEERRRVRGPEVLRGRVVVFAQKGEGIGEYFAAASSLLSFKDRPPFYVLWNNGIYRSDCATESEKKGGKG